MSFKLHTATNHTTGQSAIVEANTVLSSIYEAMRGTATRPNTMTNWILDFHGEIATGDQTSSTSSTDMGGVLFGSITRTTSGDPEVTAVTVNSPYTFVQGYIHATTGAKLMLFYSVNGNWPFAQSLLIDPSMKPSGLSMLYVPPDIAANLSWPDPNNTDWDSWGHNSKLKILSLAATKSDASSVVALNLSEIVYNYHILCDGDVIGIIEHLYRGNGTTTAKAGDYWPDQRSVGMFCGKIFQVLSNRGDENLYGAFMLQPIEPRREWDMPSGMGFWQHYKPEMRTNIRSTGCQFLYWQNDEIVTNNTMYSHDSNLLDAMSTSGYRFVPIAVGCWREQPFANDLKGYLDNGLFRMVKFYTPSGTLLDEEKFNVIGGGLAIAWNSSNTNIFNTGRPTSYSNNMGNISGAATINFDIKWDMPFVEEYIIMG